MLHELVEDEYSYCVSKTPNWTIFSLNGTAKSEQENVTLPDKTRLARIHSAPVLSPEGPRTRRRSRAYSRTACPGEEEHALREEDTSLGALNRPKTSMAIISLSSKDEQINVTDDEIDDIVSRMNRPTFMSTARELSARRVSRNDNKNTSRRHSEPPKYHEIPDRDRFSCSTPLPKSRINHIVNRLSVHPKRHLSPTKEERARQRSSLGILNSYAWNGVKQY